MGFSISHVQPSSHVEHKATYVICRNSDLCQRIFVLACMYLGCSVSEDLSYHHTATHWVVV